jgi:ABC-type antimicrobial peptide transport system permease subunit
MIPLAGGAADPNLTPSFPGITDKNSIADWDPPPQLDIDTNRIKQIDPSAEEFWDKYRATPKAYVRLDDGQALWGTRFGNTTSIRIAPKDGNDLEKTGAEFEKKLLPNLDPASVGLIVQPIRERMLAAGEGSTDFGMLFLMFSFFLIVAALVLVGLLFRLNIDRRAGEIGLLRASGFSLGAVRGLLLIEGLALAAIGSLIGLPGAIAYADLMIRLLVDLWPTPGVETYLRLHVAWPSLAIGFASSVLMSGAAIFWALRALNKVAPATLLKGDTTPAFDAARKMRPSPWPKLIALTAFLCAVALAGFGPFLPPGEPQAGAFFGSGAMLLVAGLALLWAWLKRTKHGLLSGHGGRALARLGFRNAERNPTRSILTASLLAFAAFLLVAVETFRREPEKDFLDKNGGSGGFALLAETATPIDFDLNESEGRDQLQEALEKHYQAMNLAGKARSERVAEDTAKLKDAKVFRFRVHQGDDASCLNLYQAKQPRLMGVPQAIIDRGGFSFAGAIDQPKNPWLQLTLPKDPNEGVPCLVEQATAMWMLKKDLGDTFGVPDEDGHPIKLKIVGLLKDSVFQSEVLIADAAFTHYFPHSEGFSFFLIETAPAQESEVARVLTNGLESFGFEVTPTKERVAAYLAVQNTYLSTFQLLGGFGLLLGVLGLSVVLLRSVWERRAEMALLRALGYRKRSLNAVVLAENGLLLLLGLGTGVFAALAAVAPHLASGGHVPWLRLGMMLGSIVVVGLAVAFAAIVATLRAPLIPALREE